MGLAGATALKALGIITVFLVALFSVFAGVQLIGDIIFGIPPYGDSPAHGAVVMIGFYLPLSGSFAAFFLMGATEDAKGWSRKRLLIARSALFLFGFLYGMTAAIGLCEIGIAIVKNWTLSGAFGPGYPIVGTGFNLLLAVSVFIGVLVGAILVMRILPAPIDRMPATLEEPPRRRKTTATVGSGSGSVWAGVLVGIGTFAGVAASFVGSVPVMQILLGLVAAIAAAGFAIMQMSRR
jgi:hypothetical protein